MYLTQALHRNARQMPDAPAGEDADRALTWRELHEEVGRFAAALRRDGLQPGDRVAIMARNSVDFLVYLYATWWAGGVVNPVNLRWTAHEIAFSLNDCDTRFLLVQREFLPIIPDLAATVPGLSNVVLLSHEGAPGIPGKAEWLAGMVPVEDALRRNDDLAAILYTGGTTGRSKGVMLSHANLVASMFGTIAASGYLTQRHLHVPPLFHVGALSNLIIAVATGATSFFLPAFDAAAVPEAISRWQVEELFLVPTMIRAMMDAPGFVAANLACLRRIRYGASPIDDSLLARAMAAFPHAGFAQGYGMTELSPVATVLPAQDHVLGIEGAKRRASAGRATPVCEVRVVGPDGTDRPTGEIGEITVRGPTVMLGYWNLPEATAEAVRDGWMHTGDLGFMDSEGYVTVVDRLKDMIVTGAENVYSAEVENALSSHAAVAQVAVIALPDEKWGERVHAVIVPRPGAQPDATDLVDHCRKLIAAYKLPRSFAFVEALPLTAAGKPLKSELRANPAYHG